MLYNGFQSAGHPKSVHSRASIYIPTQLSIPDCISISSALLMDTGRKSLYFTMCINTQ